MKSLFVAFILVLSVSFGLYINASNLSSRSRPCFYNDQSYSEGERIVIGGVTYECQDGEWVIVDSN